ncbi:MAG: FecR domain-containing protein, partial [Gammaproteobacteria bacterium]|nr:FecR domain-containing protein [Gammaproteobacteria bacterium]
MNHLTRFPRKTQSALVAMIAAALPASGFGAVAGHVNFAYGPVIVTSNDGGKRKITRGSPIQPGDTIDTHAGMAQIRFKDGGFISLKSQSRFQVEEYNFSGKEDGTERSFFNLIKGGFRTITGLIGGRNKKAYRVRTPVATIGIRGTAYRASYGTHMSMFITDGGIQLCNLGGCSNL